MIMANGSFKISFDTRALVIFILCVGVLFNIISFVHFYFSSSKKVDSALESLTLSSVKLYDDVIARVDDYLFSLTTNLSFSSSFTSDFNSSSSKRKEDTPILPLVDSIEYDYFVKDGRHMARIGRQDFSSGSPFPRGGVISRVYDDCIILEGGYRVARQSPRLGSSSSSSRPSVSVPSVTSSKVDFPDITSQLQKGLSL